jgi:hypothetical protein
MVFDTLDTDLNGMVGRDEVASGIKQVNTQMVSRSEIT